MSSWLAIAAGAAIGATLRFLSQKMALAYWGNLESGTLIANVAGCFAIGVLYPLLTGMAEETKLFLVTGLLRSLTTLSSLMLETVMLLMGKKLLAGWLYLAVTSAAGLGSCALGVSVGRWLSR